jgi:Transposase
VIAETVRLRRDLPIVDTVTDLTRELALLTAHRSDLIADRVRMINRLRNVMTSVFPTLEQQFDYSLPQRRAELAQRIRQPEAVAPARRDPPGPMVAPPAGAASSRRHPHVTDDLSRTVSVTAL